MEIKGSDGNTRISKIFRDITLPNECDPKTLSAKMDGAVMILCAQKIEKDNADMVPFNQRERPDNIDDDWDTSFK